MHACSVVPHTAAVQPKDEQGDFTRAYASSTAALQLLEVQVERPLDVCIGIRCPWHRKTCKSEHEVFEVDRSVWSEPCTFCSSLVEAGEDLFWCSDCCGSDVFVMCQACFHSLLGPMGDETGGSAQHGLIHS